MITKIATAFLLTVTVSFADRLPFELERLSAQRDREIEKINKIYKRQLELLKVKYTKAGNLDAANQVVAILDGHLGLATDKIAGTGWTWNHSDDNNSTIRFKIDGTVDLSWKGEGQVRWRWLGDNQLIMSSSNGLRRILSFNEEMTSYKGEAYSKKGVSKVWGDLKK